MMILPPSGSNQIVDLIASSIHVKIRRRKETPLSSDALLMQKSKIEIWGNITKLDIDGNVCGDVLGSNYALKETAPLFFEQSDYIIYAKSLLGTPLHFDHSEKFIREAISPVDEEEPDRIGGVINFGNNVGYSNLLFYDDKGNRLLIEIEVFPSKLSYKDDYASMRDEINEMVESAAIAFIKSTYAFGELNNSKNDVPAIFYALICQLFDKYYKAIKLIMQKTNHKLEKEHIVVPVHKMKRTDTKTLLWLHKHPDKVKIKDQNISVSDILTVKKKVTYNTIENQLVKNMLYKTVKRLRRFKQLYIADFLNYGKSYDKEVLNRIDEMVSKLKAQLSNPIFEEVSSVMSLETMSLVFQMAPGYRDLYRYYQLLQRGVNFSGEVYKLSLKETSVLYEYWCFIKLVNLLRSKKERFILLDNSDEIIKANRKGVTVTLSKKRKTAVIFIDRHTGDRIELTYNPGEYHSETTKQIPDNTLKLTKTTNREGEYSDFQYVFDAKYKVEMNPDSHYPDKKPGPKVEDINAMHRYRDAIISKNKTHSEKVMVGAYILFPYPRLEEEYRTHHFYKSIESVNIGGVPFLPGKTEIAEELLTTLIGESDVTAFERNILPKGVEDRLAKIDWSRKDVLVGSLSTIRQWDHCFKEQYYYVPYDKDHDQDYRKIDYVAIYQSKNLFADDAGIIYYGAVTSFERMARKEINNLPGRMGINTECVRFSVRAWERLDNKIEYEEVSVYNQRFTNYFLLHNCQRTYELFNIRSEEDYRLVYELKRIQADIKVQDKPKELFVRINENIALYNDGSNIRVFAGANECINIPVEHFKQRTSDVFARIKACVDTSYKEDA